MQLIQHAGQHVAQQFSGIGSLFDGVGVVPTSISREPWVRCILYCEGQKFMGLVIPGYIVSAVC